MIRWRLSELAVPGAAGQPTGGLDQLLPATASFVADVAVLRRCASGLVPYRRLKAVLNVNGLA